MTTGVGVVTFGPARRTWAGLNLELRMIVADARAYAEYLSS
jgi:hypothetical protein